MQFRILGPVEAIGQDGTVLPCPGQPLRLLALLLVDGTRVVPADVAIDALWGDALPANPANALQLVASRLRRVLGEDVVVWRADGYQLRLDGSEAVDAQRFERLTAQGRDALARDDHATASRLLSEALALWRGPALQDVRYEQFAVAEAERLDELRVASLEARIDADLGLGRHAELVGELQALVAEHPLREALRAQLMLALYRCGRQADALAVYGDARQRLADDLGLVPSPALRSLERDILRHRVGPPAAARPGRREIVCVAVDVRATVPLDPEVLRDVMDLCHAAMEDVAHRHGGPLHELRGSGMIAVFGAPVAHEDDARRAARAAVALQERLAEIAATLADIELDVRCGITAGTALIVQGRLPLGDVVEAAAQAARDAAPSEIVVDDRTRELLAATERTADAPLVGRHGELRLLEDAVGRAARTRETQLATVLGEPGIGKSRLARELRARLGDRATVLEGHCLPYGSGITYWPVRQMVLQAAGGRPLETLTASLPDGSAAAASVAGTLGLGDGAPGEATAWGFRRLFAAISRERPLVLQFDDVHWAEPPLLDLVDDLAARLTDAPVVLLCLARPELLAVRPAWAATAIRLGPLSAGESSRLLAGRYGLSEPQRAAVCERAGGNPLFLEQLAVHMAEHEAALPPALHALLAARLDLLALRERSLLEAAAVEGERFHLGGVLALAENFEETDARRSLDALVDRDLLLPTTGDIAGEQAWRFRHALVRDAAYASMPKTERAAGHERLASWLAAIEPRVPEADARIGTHLELAHGTAAELGRASTLAAPAARRFAAAGRHAHARGDLPSEIAFLSRACELLADDDPERAELLAVLAGVLVEAGTLERAAQIAEAALALGERLGLARVRWLAAVECVRLASFREPDTVDPAASLATVHDAAAALAELGDEFGLARTHTLLCEVLWLQGRPDVGYDMAERAVEHARRARSAFEIDTGVSLMAWALVVNAVPVSEAKRRCRRLEREVGGRFAAMTVRGFGAVLDAMAGRFDVARAELGKARRGLAELGLKQASAWMAVYDAQAEMLAGDGAAAERALDDAERIALDIGDRWFVSTVHVDRAHAMLAQDRPGAAAEAVARIEDVPAHSDMEWVVKRHAARGKLAAREGDLDRALHESRKATAVADGTGMFTFRADAHRDLAEVAARCGRDDEARAATATALTLYEAKENAAAATRLRAR